MAAATLGEALRRAEATSWSHIHGNSKMELVRDGDHFVFRNKRPRHADEIRYHSDHILPPTIALCRMYLGRQWQPEWIEVRYDRDPDADRVEERLGVPIRYRRPGTGVVLRPIDLGRHRLFSPVADLGVVTLRELIAECALASAPEPARSLSAVVALRLLDGKTDIDGAASLSGLSVQSLQRRLRQSGYTYREVVEMSRQARAAALLTENDAPVITIAMSLGYEDHANFSRAFKRWTGASPTEFRRAHRAP
jgi:AraC-like DNA-binding protein